jgi:hypothetical protein
LAFACVTILFAGAVHLQLEGKNGVKCLSIHMPFSDNCVIQKGEDSKEKRKSSQVVEIPRSLKIHVFIEVARER